MLAVCIITASTFVVVLMLKLLAAAVVEKYGRALWLGGIALILVYWIFVGK